MLNFYKILTYVLVVLGGIFAMNVLSSLAVSFSNPTLLIVSFILACVPIYIFCSASFLFNYFFKEKPCPRSLRDWIRINGIITLGFSAIMFICCLMILPIFKNSELLEKSITQLQNQPNIMANMPPQQMVMLLKTFVYIMLPVALLLIVHVILTFKLLNKNLNFFYDETPNSG